MLGNLLDVNANAPVQGMMDLARRYGTIFELELPGRKSIVVSDYALVDELSDERRFDKLVWGPLRNVRAFSGDGLFTSRTQEPNWRKAHNILLPSFSMQAMKGYMPMMVDVAEQLAQKWARLNPDDEIDVPADMTRLTLDTIGLCGFDYRFNSFYREEPHPFIVAMVRALGESLEQLHRLPVQNRLRVHSRQQMNDDIALMNELVDRIIRERRASGDTASRHDLLDHMLAGVDKDTGEGLDDINVRYQIITFLIAGHETTSGLLSFALYFLLKHPDVLARAYDEVDRVLGPDPRALPTYAQVTKLRYIGQILNETLRLWPTAPAFALSPYEPTVIGNRYAVDRESELVVLIPMLHRDPAIWGADAEEFNPDHFDPERERALPPNAFKPFGNGQRACIGRQFALQEATLVLGMLLQRFELLDPHDYQLKVKETLTLKPDDFSIQVRPRTTRTLVAAPAVESAEPDPAQQSAPALAAHGTPLLVLYGSNLGAAEGLARDIAEDGTAHGFATTLAPLDDYADAGALPRDGAVVLVSASYNGTPPDNAEKFVAWLRDESIAADALRGVRYTVFGCGNRDWASTYQAIPTLLDRELEIHGATRIYPRGEGDARDDFDGQFRTWYAPLWASLAATFALSYSVPEGPRGPRYTVEVVTSSTPAPVATEYAAQPLTVLVNRELQRRDGPNPSERSTRHIEVALPEGVRYMAGDHLGILPRNNAELVRRVAARFGFAEDVTLRIQSAAPNASPLPVDAPISLSALLTSYVELQDVATRAQIATLAAHTECPPEKRALLALAASEEEGAARYREEVLATHLSVLDLLERYASVQLPFNVYLEMLAPIRPRYYSISSSPLENPRTASITVAVTEGPSRSGQGQYAGVCSSYLARQQPGSEIVGFVHIPSTRFRLPDDATTPLVMIGAGTGLAPFRGFLRERAAIGARGEAVGPSALFLGFRSPEHDFLYEDELRAFEREGITTLYPACSRMQGQPKRYVQHEIVAHADAVWELLRQGAVVYVCGDAGRMAPAVRQALGEVYRQRTGATQDDAEVWLAGLAATNRYLADIWPSD